MSKHNRERRRKPKYMPAVEAAYRAAEAAGQVFPPGRVSFITVVHDDGCDLPRGRGECNCSPVALPPKLVPIPEDN